MFLFEEAQVSPCDSATSEFASQKLGQIAELAATAKCHLEAFAPIEGRPHSFRGSDGMGSTLGWVALRKTIERLGRLLQFELGAFSDPACRNVQHLQLSMAQNAAGIRLWLATDAVMDWLVQQCERPIRKRCDLPAAVFDEFCAAETSLSAQMASNPHSSDGSDEKREAQHSDDFHSVRWNGKSYSFSPKQAACVQLLWEHWERGTPDVGGATLLEHAESAQDKLSLVFRGHPAWRTMIVSSSKKGS